MNIDREKVSSMLGFSDIIYNSIDATSSRDSLIEFASACLICMLNLCKMAEDFIIWSTSEFGFVLLNDQFSSSSSVMPQKKNPDPLELIRGIKLKNAGDDPVFPLLQGQTNVAQIALVDITK